MSLENDKLNNSVRDPYRANKGLINGNGFTNGLGANNTPTGLINGNGLTNGNGMTDRKYTRIPLIESKRLKRRVLGIILAFALIVAPLFIYLIEFGDTPSGMIIDGNFSDWDDKEGYRDSSSDVTANPNINIVEYKMLREDNDVHFYVEVQGNMLKGTNSKVTDTMHIFVDSDTNSETGYSVEGLGADYMLEAQGKSGRIIESKVKIFDPTYRTEADDIREQNDWNGWTDLQNGELKCVSNKMEARMALYDHQGTSPAISENVFAVMRLADANGNEDYSDTIASTEKGALIVKQTPLVDNIVAEDISEILELEFTALDKDVTITTLNLDHTGGGKLFPMPMPMTITQGSTETVTVTLDTTTAAYGDYATVAVSAITTRDNVPVTLSGEGSRAYIKAVPKVINIDGVFADWDNIASVVDEQFEETLNGNDNIDIVEHRNVNQNDKLSFYLKVDGSMMEGSKVLTKPMVWERSNKASSSDPDVKANDPNLDLLPLPVRVGKDAAYILLDTDNNPRTGYRAREMDIGADYMVMVTGHDGSILSRALYKYDPVFYNQGWSWLNLENTEVLAATDATQLEAQINIVTFELNDEDNIGVYYMMTDWNGAKDSSERAVKLDIPGINAYLMGDDAKTYMIRGQQGTITYGDGLIDATWAGLAVDIGDGNDVGAPNGGDIIDVTVCDNYTATGFNISQTWVNFLIEMQAAITENVFVYIDTNYDGVADWALAFDVVVGILPFGAYYQWTGFWSAMGAIPFDWPMGSDVEFGINLTMIGSPQKFQYYVTTEAGTGVLDPPGGVIQDRAPNAGWQNYIVIPEFGALIIPVLAIVPILLIIRRKRRKVTLKKEVSL